MAIGTPYLATEYIGILTTNRAFKLWSDISYSGTTGGTCTYYWDYSTDEGQTWTVLKAAGQSNAPYESSNSGILPVSLWNSKNYIYMRSRLKHVASGVTTEYTTNAAKLYRDENGVSVDLPFTHVSTFASDSTMQGIRTDAGLYFDTTVHVLNRVRSSTPSYFRITYYTDTKPLTGETVPETATLLYQATDISFSSSDSEGYLTTFCSKSGAWPFGSDCDKVYIGLKIAALNSSKAELWSVVSWSENVGAPCIEWSVIRDNEIYIDKYPETIELGSIYDPFGLTFEVTPKENVKKVVWYYTRNIESSSSTEAWQQLAVTTSPCLSGTIADILKYRDGMATTAICDYIRNMIFPKFKAVVYTDTKVYRRDAIIGIRKPLEILYDKSYPKIFDGSNAIRIYFKNLWTPDDGVRIYYGGRDYSHSRITTWNDISSSAFILPDILPIHKTGVYPVHVTDIPGEYYIELTIKDNKILEWAHSYGNGGAFGLFIFEEFSTTGSTGYQRFDDLGAIYEIPVKNYAPVQTVSTRCFPSSSSMTKTQNKIMFVYGSKLGSDHPVYLRIKLQNRSDSSWGDYATPDTALYSTLTPAGEDWPTGTFVDSMPYSATGINQRCLIFSIADAQKDTFFSTYKAMKIEITECPHKTAARSTSNNTYLEATITLTNS